jgi:hypothetical protein
MARYRVLTTSFINNSIQEEGAIVEYDGKPGRNLELVEDGDKPEPHKGKGKKGAVASAPDDAANVFGGE